MIAGTLAVLKSAASEPLEDYLHNAGLPALSVDRNQQGKAAGRMDIVEQSISAGGLQDSDGVYIDVEQIESRQRVATEWVADVTDSGVILVESMAGSEPPFPLGLFWDQTGREPIRQDIDVAELHRAWSRDDVLGEVWMTSSADEEEGASIAYHDAADESDTPTIGLGFRRPWDGTAIRGVVYESGYVALYSANTASKAVRFVADELLPFCEARGDVGSQVTLTEASSGDDFADKVADHLDTEGVDYERGVE